MVTMQVSLSLSLSLSLSRLSLTRCTAMQVCVVDHTDGNYRPPHMHLQLLFSDSSRSQWIQLNQVTVPQLQTALAELVVPASQPQPQLHLHEVEPVSHGVDLAVQERLPRHELSAAEAALWTRRGRQCPICLAALYVSTRHPALGAVPSALRPSPVPRSLPLPALAAAVTRAACPPARSFTPPSQQPPPPLAIPSPPPPRTPPHSFPGRRCRRTTQRAM